MFTRKGFSAVLVLALALSAVGAKEAFASHTRTPATCPEPSNWCYEDWGGQANCDACCQLRDYDYGICFGYAYEETQRCLCVD
jgi:hypothetical protein